MRLTPDKTRLAPRARPSDRNTAVLPRLIGALLLLATLCPTLTFAAPAPAADLSALEERTIKQAAATVAASLVRIETVGGLDRIGEMLAGTGPTTGVIVSDDGYVISSSFNFASKPASILVTLADGRKLAATLVASDRLKMLALLKVDAKDLTVPTAAPADSLRVGQTAIALGKTYDEVQPTISVGIISALGRIWGKAIQTDAKVSPVNYGGALVDLEGRILGVIVPLSPQATGELAGVEWYDGGIGFAIPFTEIQATLSKLKAGKDLFPGQLGVYLKGKDLYEIAPTIDRMRFGAPAQAAGLKVGDVLTELDGRKVVRQAQVLHVLGNKYAGDKLTVKAKRGTETVTAEVPLVDKLDPYEPTFLGILPVREPTSAPLPAAAAKSGVAIRFVFPKSPAATAGLAKGERIISVDKTVVNDPAALLDQISRHRPGDKLHLQIEGASGRREVDVALAKVPNNLPADLSSVAIPPPEKPAAGATPPKTGRISDRHATHEHEYWAYVPQDYNPAHRYALLVWMHPPGDTHEAAMLNLWKPLCEERGIILLAPKAKLISGWNPTELEFVKDLVEQFQQTYHIDKSRVVLHSFSQSSVMACVLAARQRQLFTGLCLASPPLVIPPPENEPEHRLQFFLLSGDKDSLHKSISTQVQMLEKLKYPVQFNVIPGGEHKYPPASEVRDIARWIDILDRI